MHQHMLGTGPNADIRGSRTILMEPMCMKAYSVSEQLNFLNGLTFLRINSEFTTKTFKCIENFTTKKEKFSDENILTFFILLLKHRLWVLVRTASARRF